MPGERKLTEKNLRSDFGGSMRDYKWDHGSGMTAGSIERALDAVPGGMPFLHDYADLPFPDVLALKPEQKSMLRRELTGQMTGVFDLEAGKAINGDGYACVSGLATALAMEPDKQMFTPEFLNGCAAMTSSVYGPYDNKNDIDTPELRNMLSELYGASSAGAGDNKKGAATFLAASWVTLNEAYPAVTGVRGDKLPDRAAAQYVLMDKACNLMGYDLEFDPVKSSEIEAMMSGRGQLGPEGLALILEESMHEHRQRQSERIVPDEAEKSGAEQPKKASALDLIRAHIAEQEENENDGSGYGYAL